MNGHVPEELRKDTINKTFKALIMKIKISRIEFVTLIISIPQKMS